MMCIIWNMQEEVGRRERKGKGNEEEVGVVEKTTYSTSSHSLGSTWSRGTWGSLC